MRKLMIGGMLNLSLAHAGPNPYEFEARQGVYSGYIQFMDNVCRNWISGENIGTSAAGVDRLKELHALVREQNKGDLRDPVTVANNGVAAEFGTAMKLRKNYAFYEGYSRIDCEMDIPEYATDEYPGVGIMVRVSDNIQTYVARPDTNNMFDTAIVHPAARRFIFPANDSSLAVFGLDSNGVWVKGVDPTKEDQQWSIGITPVRMPFNGGSVQAGHGFSLAEEGDASGDPKGTLVGGVENSILRMYALEKSLNKTDTCRNEQQPEFLLHGQSRILSYNNDYMEGDSVSFSVIPEMLEDTAKVWVKEKWGNEALIIDTSHTIGTLYAVGVEWVNGKRARVFIKSDLISRTIAFKDVVDGVYIAPIEAGTPFARVRIEKNSQSWPPRYIRENATYDLKWSKGIRPNKYDSFDKDSRLFDGEQPPTLNWEEFEENLVDHPYMNHFWCEIKYCNNVEYVSVDLQNYGLKKGEIAIFDMASNYNEAYSIMLDKLLPQCDCVDESQRDECISEAHIIVEEYLAMFCQYANAEKSYGIEKYGLQNDDLDIRNGWYCYQWAFWTQSLLNDYDFNHFNIEWSSYATFDVNNEPVFQHSWISTYSCNSNEGDIIHLDPWADLRVMLYTTEEHGNEVWGQYGQRNFIGEIGLPRGAVNGILFYDDGSFEAKFYPHLWTRW